MVKLTISRRQRGTPYTPRIEDLGVSAYSIVNRTILPKGFRKSVEEGKKKYQETLAKHARGEPLT